MAYTSGIEPALYIDLGLQGKMQQNRPQEQWERVEVPDGGSFQRNSGTRFVRNASGGQVRCARSKGD
jgi:hypothetical protein